MFFFFKQKTAYEMRISDWSSDVCSSDLSALRPFGLRDGIVDLAAYELCALSQLRERLRAGDIWVSGSRQFRDFDSYLIPPATFDALREKGPLPLAIETDFDRHIEERRARLDTAIEQVTVLARQGELPQVRLDE